MTTIKPSEVSAIIREELTGFKNIHDLDETGTVLHIGDGIARIYGLSNIESGEIVDFNKENLFGIAMNLDEDNVGAVLLGDATVS
ncbi:MAG: F0F1 ATP synthase subunit alpha, partial [Bacteroidales bacterium]|nr:F0F1 ATP synthase subunit alpha [Bacteroidales bacterium]